MAKSEGPVEVLDLDEDLEREASDASSASRKSPDEDFGDLLEEEQQNADGEEGGDMDLSELEAFLDDFNRSTDDENEKPAGEGSENAIHPDSAEEDRAEPSMSEVEMMEAAAEHPGAPMGEEDPVGESGHGPELSDAEAEMMAAAAEDPGASVRGEESSGDEVSVWEGADESAAADLAEDELDLSFGEQQTEEERAGGEFEELDLDAFDSEQPETPEAPEVASGFSFRDGGPPDDFEAMDADTPHSAGSPGRGETTGQSAFVAPTADTPGSTGTGRGMLIAALLAGLGLLTAGGAAYLAYGLSSEVERLNRSVAAFETSGAGAAEGNAELGQRVDQALRETKKLSARLSELAIIIEGPMSHLRESNERGVKNLLVRIDELESSLESLEKQTADLAATPRVAKAAPMDSLGWSLNLVSFSSRRTAEEERQRLSKLGVDAELHTAIVNGRTWHRLQVGGFASKAEAEAYLSRIKTVDGLDGAWVTH